MESIWNLCSGAHEIVVNIQSKPYRIYRKKLKLWRSLNEMAATYAMFYVHDINSYTIELTWHKSYEINSRCAVKQRPTNLL